MITRDDDQLGKLIKDLKTGKRPAAFTESCPDDELLASYSDGLLDDLAKDRLESSSRRLRGMLGRFDRSVSHYG